MLPGHENRSVWLAQTKFQPPRLGRDFIVRWRLLDVLAAAVGAYALTLVSAPAGYGKTTLLASFSSASAKIPLTWLSLDEEDNDPTHLILQRL